MATGLVKVSPNTEGEPVYEVIKREDIEGAFNDALNKILPALLERLNEIATIFSSTVPQSLWTWGYTSRWGFDRWY